MRKSQSSLKPPYFLRVNLSLITLTVTWFNSAYPGLSWFNDSRHFSLSSSQLFIFSIVRAGDAIYVRVGDHDLTQKYGSPGAQTLRVATTYIHHNHNSQTLDNDIALLKLHGEADLKEGVCLVCIPARGTSQVM